MKYHQATFKLLGKTPQKSPRGRAAIAQAEKRLGYPLPDSLREWYSCLGAEAMLRYGAGCDDPVPLSSFGEEDDGIEEETAEHFAGKLIIRHENQGCCLWAVDLNGADDPPVCVVVDGYTGFDDGFDWVQAHPTYSQYLYTCMWDTKAVRHKWLAQAQNGPLSPRALETLRAKFTAGPVSYGWPYDVEYRFWQDEVQILLHAEKECCDWFVGANTKRSFLQSLQTVGELDEVMSRFYGCPPRVEEAITLARKG